MRIGKTYIFTTNPAKNRFFLNSEMGRIAALTTISAQKKPASRLARK
jgi:hypothetical protein